MPPGVGVVVVGGTAEVPPPHPAAMITTTDAAVNSPSLDLMGACGFAGGASWQHAVIILPGSRADVGLSPSERHARTVRRVAA